MSGVLCTILKKIAYPCIWYRELRAQNEMYIKKKYYKIHLKIEDISKYVWHGVYHLHQIKIPKD